MRSTSRLGLSIIFGSLITVIRLAPSAAVAADTLAGAIDSSPKWGSGWIDFAPPVDFMEGDHLKLFIGGSPDKIVVRLLPKSAAPDISAGVVGGATDVPKSRILEIVLPQDRKQVVQLSVHGGPNPWGKFPLGGGNGPATLESAGRIKAK